MLGLGVGDLGDEAGVGRHAVGDGLDAAVWQQDAVLPRHHAAVARLLLVEVVPDVVLDGVAVPEKEEVNYRDIFACNVPSEATEMSGLSCIKFPIFENSADVWQIW